MSNYRRRDNLPPFAGTAYSLWRESGLTQEAFAERMGVPRRTLQNWIAGVGQPAKYAQKNIIAQMRAITKKEEE